MKQHWGPVGSGCCGSCSTPLLLSPGIRVWSDRRTRPAGSLFPVSLDDLDDIRRRLRAVEHDAAAARVLAGAADRDVSEIRAEIGDFRQATTSSFNALRADFIDLREDFSDLRDEVGRGFSEMRGKLDASAAGQQRIAELIESLIDQQNG